MKKQKLKLLTTFLSASMLLNTFTTPAFAYVGDETSTQNKAVFDCSELMTKPVLDPTISPDVNTKGNGLVNIIVEFKTTPLAVANVSTKSSKSSKVSESIINTEHNDFKNALNKNISTQSIDDSSNSGITFGQEFSYAFNGMAVTIPANQVETLLQYSQVKKIWNNVEFKLPENDMKQEDTTQIAKGSVTGSTAEAPLTVSTASSPSTAANYTMDSFSTIGVDKLHDEGIMGSGIKVGVLDTGIDYRHPDLKDVYKGGYDSIDNDTDPMEASYDEWKTKNASSPWKYPEFNSGSSYYTSHGTHVAGTIAGTAKNTQGNVKAIGIAPKVSLYSYRVLGPYGSGSSESVLGGIDKAVQAKMDVINLSLGAVVNNSLYPTSVAINNAAKAGVIPVVAAGNSGPNEYTLGSPGTSPLAITVGASDITYTLPSYTGFASANITMKLLGNELGFDVTTLKDQSLEMVNCGIGQASDFQGKDLIGKIALIQRGTLSFQEKIVNAKKAGAEVVFIYNNLDGYIDYYLDSSFSSLPTFNLTKVDGDALVNNLGTIKTFTFKTLTSETMKGDNLASFSSRGPVANSSEIKPDVIAPGVNILSTYPEYIYNPQEGLDWSTAYNKISGTSMATPHVAGIVALMVGEAKKQGKALSVSDVKTVLMNTSDNLNGDYSVFEKGAGRVDAYEAVKNTIQFKVRNTIQTVENEKIVDIDTMSGALQFGSIYKTDKDALVDKTVTIFNNSNVEKEFNVTVEHSTPKGSIKNSATNNVEIKIPQTVKVPANGSIVVSASLVIPRSAKYGYYEGTLRFTNINNNSDDYVLPYGVRYAEKGIKDFFTTKKAVSNDYANPAYGFMPYTEVFVSLNSPAVSGTIYLKDPKTGKRIGVANRINLSQSLPDFQYLIPLAFNCYIMPMIGDYVENRIELVPAGDYKLELEVIDENGQKYTSEDDVIVDNTPPVITFDKAPGLYTISEDDYTIEDGKKAFYIHGKVNDETITKLQALGHKIDGNGKSINQKLTTMNVYFGRANDYNGNFTHTLTVNEDGTFKIGIEPKDFEVEPLGDENGGLDLIFFPYDYSSTSTKLGYNVSFNFMKADTSYGTITYDKTTNIKLNDTINAQVKITNINKANKVEFSLYNSYLYNDYVQIESVSLNENFKQFLAAQGITPKLSYDTVQSYDAHTNISLELPAGKSIDVSDLTAMFDVKAKVVKEYPGLYFDRFVFKNGDYDWSQPDTPWVEYNTYTDLNGNKSTIQFASTNNFFYNTLSSGISSFTSGQGFFDDKGWSKSLPYDKLGTKVFLIYPDGKRIDLDVSSRGKIISKDIVDPYQDCALVPASEGYGTLYVEIPGHFKNWAPVKLGYTFNDELSGLYTSVRMMTAYAGDINGDNIINKTDLDLLNADFGKPFNGTYLVTDLNKDKFVDSNDIALINKNMGMVNPRLVEAAEVAIATLKVSQDIKDIQNAVDKANLLPESPVKQNLLNSIKEISDPIYLKEAITSATKAVEKAETSLTQADVDAAAALVNALADSDIKNSLLERLNKVQSSINDKNALEVATKSVEKSEASLTQADVNAAMTLVSALQASDAKNSLMARLTVVQNVVDATVAIAKAEASFTQADVDAAKALVNALSDSATKTSLMARLTAVQNVVDVTVAITKAEASFTQADVDAAKALVNALSDSATKTNLMARLTAVQNVVDATSALTKAESSLVKADVDAAKALINALPDGTIKTELLNKLNNISQKLPQAGAPIGTSGILAIGGLLSAAGVAIFRKKKETL